MGKTLDSFFRKGFKSSKCKTLLKITVSRIKLLRNKREAVAKQTRQDVAQLLKNGQEKIARNRVELVYREENALAAYDLIEQYCELVVKRLSIISAQKLCPTDLKEAVSSLIFAAPRCADLHELQEVRHIFEVKYGKDFVVAAAELRPDCGVSRQIIEKLSSRSPDGKVKLKLMKEIVAENKIEWDPKEALDEFVKPPEDLPDGPKHFPIASLLTADSGKDNPVSELVLKVSSAQAYPPPPGPTLLTSSSSSDSYTEEDGELAKGKSPPPGKYDLPPWDASRFTEYAGLEPQEEVNHSSMSEEIPGADPYASAKAEGRMDYEHIYDPHSRARTDRWKQYGGSTETKSEQSITSSPRQQFGDDASSTKGINLEYQDVASAAQAAFESAAHAAAAARMVVDLAKRDPRYGSMNRTMTGPSFKSEKDLDSSKIFNNYKVAQVIRNGRSAKSKEELENFEVIHTKKVAQFARNSVSSESDEEFDSFKVSNTELAAHIESNDVSSESEEELDKKVAGVARYGPTLVHNHNLEASSEIEHELNDIRPFTEDLISQHANWIRNSVDKSPDYDDEVDQVSLPMQKHKDTSSFIKSSTPSFYEAKLRKQSDFSTSIGRRFDDGEREDHNSTFISPRKAKPRKQSDFSTFMGRSFDNGDEREEDNNSTFISTRAHAARDSHAKFVELNSPFAKPEEQGRDKPSTLEEGGLHSRDQLGYGQRWRSEAKASPWHESQVERDAQAHLGRSLFDNVEPDDLSEKRVPLSSYNQLELPAFVYGSQVGKAAQTDSGGTNSTLNKSEGSTYGKLRWQSHSSEEPDSPLQSNEPRYQKPDELFLANSGLGYDVGRGIQSESRNHAMQARTKWEDDDGREVSTFIKARSRRSVRSVSSYK